MKKQNDISKEADEAVKRIAEKFAEIVTAKIAEVTDEFHAIMDGHLDDIEDFIAMEFQRLHGHIDSLARLEKLEKKVEKLESATNKKYIS